MKELIYGVGVNDADYVIQLYEQQGYVDGKRKQKLVWTCPFYRVWAHMLARGHSIKLKLDQPAYKDVTVCQEWHLFSTFKSWMEKQDYEGNQLDKDLLLKGNKVYSPKTCVFVSSQVNSFILDSGKTRGKYKIGAYWNKNAGKFMAQCRNPFNIKKKKYLGYFTNEDDAHQAWLAKKLEYAYALAVLQTDERVAKALIDRYENWTA